jgi:hypothetical protein
MPILTCPNTIGKCTALWNYIPNEDIDFNKYYFVKTLRIECFAPNFQEYPQLQPVYYGFNYNPPRIINPYCEVSRYYYDWHAYVTQFIPNIPSEPYILPSLKTYFPNLEILIIKNAKGTSPVYIKELTDLPDTVVVLDIQNTFIQNIGYILSISPNLEILKLQQNQYKLTIPKLPQNLKKLYITLETLTDPIVVNSKLKQLYLIQSSISKIDNLKFVENCNIIMYGCESPYDNSILNEINTTYKDRIKYINYVNDQQVYLDFGSIPSRIRLTHEDDKDKHIIIALTLASNTARRMAEFIA